MCLRAILKMLGNRLNSGWKKNAHEVVWKEIQAVYEESGVSVVCVRVDVLEVDKVQFLPEDFYARISRELGI